MEETATRIVTWNCARGPLAKKRAALDALAPDIVVLTEASRPTPTDDDVLWFGDGRNGVARGLVSAYHGERSLGDEADPTHYFLWNERRPFHIDYCFVPREWLIEAVAVGSFADWAALSDHRPITVDVRVR